MSFYAEIIKSGIVFRRPFRAASNAFQVFRSAPKAGKPFMLKFESSAICNLRCKMCPLSNGLSRKTGVLAFKNFKKVYDELTPCYLNLTGIGEPLLNPEIFKIIEYARKKGSLVKMDTNATLLTDEKIKKLIDADPTFLSVSLDGITKESYNSIRRGANFDDVIQNLKKLVKYRNKVNSKTKIHLFLVLQKDNVLDLPEFIRFGDKLGIDAVNSTIVTPLGKNKNLGSLKIKEEDKKRIKEEIDKLKGKIKISFNIESVYNFLTGKVETMQDKKCFWPWYQFSLTWDGYVTPCCVLCDNEIVLGNAFKENSMKVWNNQKMQQFRKQMIRQRAGLCLTCSVDESFIYNKFKPFYKTPLINLLSYRR